MIKTSSNNNYYYQRECYLKLVPKLSFFKKWHDNIGKIPEEENNRYYVQEYWNQVLSKLDPEEIYDELDYSTLLNYESNTKFCHRHIVAAWFEILLDESVPEVEKNEYQEEKNRKTTICQRILRRCHET